MCVGFVCQPYLKALSERRGNYTRQHTAGSCMSKQRLSSHTRNTSLKSKWKKCLVYAWERPGPLFFSFSFCSFLFHLCVTRVFFFFFFFFIFFFFFCLSLFFFFFFLFVRLFYFSSLARSFVSSRVHCVRVSVAWYWSDWWGWEAGRQPKGRVPLSLSFPSFALSLSLSLSVFVHMSSTGLSVQTIAQNVIIPATWTHILLNLSRKHTL